MTNAEILNNVALIRDAENPGENSAQRVGSTLEGIAQLAINNENKIKTLEGNENSTQDSIDILNGYFTQNQGEDGRLSLNRWNMAYYLNEAMVWGGDINGSRRVTTSEALLSKNPGCKESFTLMSGMYTSFKNVYFTATDYIHSDGFVASKGDIILSTGTRWTTLISTHPRKEYSYTNPDMILFEFYKNEDEFVHYMFNNNYIGSDIFNVTTDIRDTTNKMTFYVLVTNNSTEDITFNLPYNQVLVIPQGKERYFEARFIDDRYVFAIPPLSDTESKISTLEGDTATLNSRLGELNDKIRSVNNEIDNFSIKSTTSGTITADAPYKSFKYGGALISIIEKDLISWKIDFLMEFDSNFPNIEIDTDCTVLPKNVIILDYNSSEFMGMRPVESHTIISSGDKISIERFGDNIYITLIKRI